MSATRASSMRALKYLSAHGRQVVRGRQLRQLHMTGPATFPSPLLTAERPAVNLPRDVAGLRAECSRRKLPTAGNKAELTDRLTSDSLHARGFSSAIDPANRRPAANDAAAAPSAQPARHFNTSRTLKSVNDSSTIDFAYLPDDAGPVDADSFAMRVPLLPVVNFNSPSSRALPDDVEIPVRMRPEISTVSAATTYFHAPSALSDVTDNTTIDFQGLANAVNAATSKFRSAPQTESAQSMLMQVWNGLLDDLLGPKASPGMAR